MSKYPIQRLVVYPAYPGKTYVTWDLHPNMQDLGPYKYQLQRCLSANPDDEWENVGEEQTDVPVLVDPESIRTGYLLDCFYRIVLTTGRNATYVSEPEGCFGQLHRDEWKLALEILSKENLLFKKTAVPGALLQVIRQGALQGSKRCPYCSGEYDNGIVNSQCEHCFGTGYLGGYHKPFHFQAWQVTPSQKQEIHYSDNVATMNMSVDRYQARATGIPEVYNGDIWVDLSTAQRFKVQASKVIAQIRRVPLVRMIDMILLPASDIAYKIPIGRDNYSSIITYEVVGCHDKVIDHNYPSTDDLRYVVEVNGKYEPIAGAKITIECNESNGENQFVFATTTNVEGRWEQGYKAEVGKTYTITFEKEGVYGPDYAQIVVQPEELTEEEKAAYDDKQEQKAVNYFTTFEV